MWTYEKQEIIDGNTLLYFKKDQIDRNTIILGLATEAQIQELIDNWNAEDALLEEAQLQELIDAQKLEDNLLQKEV